MSRRGACQALCLRLAPSAALMVDVELAAATARSWGKVVSGRAAVETDGAVGRQRIELHRWKCRRAGKRNGRCNNGDG